MLGLAHRLVARILGRRGAGVARALDVVLAAQRVDARALAAEVAGQQRQIAEALHVVDTADVLGDAECIVDRGAFGLAIPERGLLDVLRGYTVISSAYSGVNCLTCSIKASTL